MFWTIVFILIYILSLVTVIKAARTGKGLFFPNFRKIDEVYFLGMKKVWSTWWGKLGYYLQLIFHLATVVILLFILTGGIYAYFQPR